MRSALTYTAAVFILLLASASNLAAQIDTAIVRGDVVDASGGVLPGVTVVAKSESGNVIASGMTDQVGRFVLEAVPPGAVTLTFELQGFESITVRLAIYPGAELWVSERLSVAPLADSVLVHADVPVDLSRDRASRRPPAPVTIPIPADDLSGVCGPAKPPAIAESLGTIQAHRYETERGLYRLGDELMIDGGTDTGLRVGRNLVARRDYRTPGPSGLEERGEHTAGVVQIVAADARTATAVVVYTCNELATGDRLEAFRPEPSRAAEPAGIPFYRDPARILFADAGQMMGVPRRMMVIDRGYERGVRPGQRLTLFKRRRSDNQRIVIGEALVVAVRKDSATIRVETAHDAVSPGDWAAMQHPMPETSSGANTSIFPAR